MEPQERDLITTLLTRLQSTAGQPKDPEADAMIRQAMTQMPDAPYYLVQTVLIQDLSLHNAQNRIAELEKQAASLNPPQQQGAPTSFLGGLFGRSGSAPAPAPSVPPSGGPWTRVQQPAPPPPQYAPSYAQPGYTQPAPAAGVFGSGAGGGGNSFLRSAATTAAGVAGGALLFEGISSLFGHGFAGGLGGMGMGGMGGMPGGLGETVVNNYYGDGQGAAPGDYGGGGDSGGGDYGGGGDTGSGSGDYGGGGDSGDYGGGGDSGGGDFGGGDDSSSSC